MPECPKIYMTEAEGKLKKGDDYVHPELTIYGTCTFEGNCYFKKDGNCYNCYDCPDKGAV